MILLPGGVLPAAVAYPALIEQLGDGASCLPKEAELFSGDRAPADYSLDMEVEGVLRAAADVGFERFGLVGYSMGGATALALAERHPGRVASLALVEPAPIRALSPGGEDDAMWLRIEEMMAMPPEERAKASASMLLKPGTPPPPPRPGPPPPWMASRMAAFEPMMRATWFYPLDIDRLRGFAGPVWLAVGSLSHPVFERQARHLGRLWPHMRLQTFEGLHHLNPPHLADPNRVAEAIRSQWASTPAR